MEVQASTDGLTGLFNHRRFQEALALEVARAERYDTEFCLLMIDLDRFKSVNDTVGHQRGDEVLRDVAEVLRRCSRESDFAARYGGEEFAMILPHADIDEARRVAERVRGQVADLSAVEPGPVGDDLGGHRLVPAPRDRHRRHPGRGRRGPALPPRRAAATASTPSATTKPTPGAGRDAARRSRPSLRARAGFSGRGRRSGRRRCRCSRPSEAPPASGRRGPSPHRRRGDGASVDHLFAALLYGTERWDGSGYPEGLRGESIPRVARAFAVLRAYSRDGADGGAALRAQAGRRFDPRMVNRFLAFLGEEASRWNPLAGVADERG